MAVVDEVSPSDYGQDLLVLALSLDTPRVQVFEPVIVTVDYSKTAPAGIVLPLEMTITSESGAAVYQRRVFKKFAPPILSFVPREGGKHLVRLAEQHHNRWFGALVLDVQGFVLKAS